MSEVLLKTLEAQVFLGFTGKINFMTRDQNQLLGCALFVDGELVNVKYKGSVGAKAFYNSCIEFMELKFKTLIEPEIITSQERLIKEPLSVLKSKLVTISDQYKLARSNKPPGYLTLSINPSFLNGDILINSAEFNLLCTLIDYNKVSDIYIKNELLDFEITDALISLRQKKAIKVMAQKE